MGERYDPPIYVRDDKDAPARSAPYREPVELACFSKSRANGTQYDKSMLKQYLRPEVPFDLSQGYDTFIDRDRNVARPASLDPIFGALRSQNVEDKELASADVITWRGNFAKLLATPWNHRDPWHMECELISGVLILNVLEPEILLEKERKKDKKSREALMCYWGFSFEEQCTGGTYDEPVDCANAFCAVVRAGVGSHRLVLGGEVDCWDGEKHGLPGYVELKTTRVMETDTQVRNFERDKLLKWWAQSFALGVRRILVGFRDDSGAVRKLQTLDTLKLPGYAARHQLAWDPKTALKFADKVLTEVKQRMRNLPEGSKIRLEYEPKRNKDQVLVVVDDSIPNFVPAEGRAALARASVIRASGGATSSGGRSGSRSRGSGGGGSVTKSGGGGSVGGGINFLEKGTAASAKRGVVFREPDPPGRYGRGSGWTSEKGHSVDSGGLPSDKLGGPGSTPARVGLTGGSDDTGAPSPTPGSPTRRQYIRSGERHGASTAGTTAATTGVPVERFVHWGAGGSTDSGAGTGGASHSHHERRRRRRHGRSGTPGPGGGGGDGGVTDGGHGGTLNAHTRESLDRGGTRDAASVQPSDRRGSDRSDRSRWSDRNRGVADDRNDPTRSTGRNTFCHPIVAGPGVGDPFKLAASKLAYARSLGPTAMRFLMGFTPGEIGWNGGEDGGVTEKPPLGVTSTVAGGGDGAVDRDPSSSKKHDSTNVGAIPTANTTDAFSKPIGLDPRAFAFDPLNPTATSNIPGIHSGLMTHNRPDGSEGDGQQNSYVSTGDTSAGDPPNSGNENTVDRGSPGAGGPRGRLRFAPATTATSNNDAELEMGGGAKRVRR